MQFSYLDNANEMIGDILGNVEEFEDQVAQASGSAVAEIAVRPLKPGRSGAAVFLIRHADANGPRAPLVAKICADPKLIIQERKINQERVAGKVTAAPTLVPIFASRILLCRFAESLADFNPTTLERGYAQSSVGALEALMSRVVTSLKSIVAIENDVMSCVGHMPRIPRLDTTLADATPHLSDDQRKRLLDRWRNVHQKRDTFPHVRGLGHGDLNAGNVLFEAGADASYPVIIDFATMARSKDNVSYPEFRHIPFWDYAKLERDLQTRLFLREAAAAGMTLEQAVAAIRAANGGSAAHVDASFPPIRKLFRTTHALRAAIRDRHSPDSLNGAYAVSVAYALLSVHFRSDPDTDIDPERQHTIALEAAVQLLDDPTRFPMPPSDDLDDDRSSNPPPELFEISLDEQGRFVDPDDARATLLEALHATAPGADPPIRLRADMIDRVRGRAADLEAKADRTPAEREELISLRERTSELNDVMTKMSWCLQRLLDDGQPWHAGESQSMLVAAERIVATLTGRKDTMRPTEGFATKLDIFFHDYTRSAGLYLTKTEESDLLSVLRCDDTTEFVNFYRGATPIERLPVSIWPVVFATMTIAEIKTKSPSREGLRDGSGWRFGPG